MTGATTASRTNIGAGAAWASGATLYVGGDNGGTKNAKQASCILSVGNDAGNASRACPVFPQRAPYRRVGVAAMRITMHV